MCLLTEVSSSQCPHMDSLGAMGAPAEASFRQSRRELLLRKRLRGDVYKLSEFHRGRLDRSGLGSKLESASDLAGLAPMTLEDVASASTLTLWPRHRSRRYRVSLWDFSGRVPLGYSQSDLTQLTRIGRQCLQMAGLGKSDVLVDLLAGGAVRDRNQLVSAARKASISVLSGTRNAEGMGRVAKRLDVTAAVGEASALADFLDTYLDSSGPNRIHTVVVTGRPGESVDEGRLARLCADVDAKPLRMWAPDGVMSAWMQCRGGTGLHVPGADLIEVVDPLSGLPAAADRPGVVLWTGASWWATAVIRCRVSAAGILQTGPCEACGRHTPRLVPYAEPASFADYLSSHPDLDSWAAELHQARMGDELHVWVVPKAGKSDAAFLEQLSRQTGATRLSISDPIEVNRIITSSNGERFGDRRAFAMRGT